VLQTTYLKILDGRARFDGRSSVLTWLFAVIRKSAVDVRRRRYVHALAAQLLGRQLGEGVAASAEDALEASQSQRAVVAAMRRVSSRQREVLLLVFYHELTVEDAAQVMGVSAGAARQHYARGRRALRALLGAREIRP
jgi:RNA polymerase sigma factor (sigma-70 family)